MRLSALLKDRRGTLYEIPLLIMFLGLALAIGLGERSWWKGPVYAFLILFGILGGLVALGVAGDKLEKIPWIAKVMDWRIWPLVGAGFAYLVGIVGGGAAAAFAAIFIAPHMADMPAGQLAAMRMLTALGAAGGAALTWKIRRQPPRF